MPPITATLSAVLICSAELVTPAIIPENAGATWPVTIRTSVGIASPWPRPVAKRSSASGSMAGGVPVSVWAINHARPANPEVSNPIPMALR